MDASPVPGADTYDDIWKITVRHEAKVPSGAVTGRIPQHTIATAQFEVLWVLAATGEPLGHAPADPFLASEDSGHVPVSLRVDWHTRLSSDSERRTTLMDRVHWTNAEEYTHGISSHWLKIVSQEGSALRIAQQKVAERYILANVAGNRLVFPLWSLTDLPP
jgi:hypothetical protein